MILDLDDATIKHAVHVTFLAVLATSFLGAFLAQFSYFLIGWLAEVIVRRKKRKLAALASAPIHSNRPVAWMAGIQTAGGSESAAEWDVVFSEGEVRPFGDQQWIPLYTAPSCISVTHSEKQGR